MTKYTVTSVLTLLLTTAQPGVANEVGTTPGHNNGLPCEDSTHSLSSNSFFGGSASDLKNMGDEAALKLWNEAADNPELRAKIREARVSRHGSIRLWKKSTDQQGLIDEINQLIKQKPWEHKLSLRNDNLPDFVSTLMEILQSHPQITTLDLSSNRIGNERLKALAAALANNTTLTTLDLGNTDLGDEDAQVLAAALKENSTLTTLNLIVNSIGAMGAKALAAALKENSTLIYLNLRGNRIGDNGAQALAMGLEGNKSLTNLHLYGNFIRDEGAQALAATFEKSTALICLNLGNNTIDNKISQQIREIEKKREACKVS